MSNLIADNIKSSMQYVDYLKTHITGVQKVFEETMLPILKEEDIDENTLDEIRTLITEHDKSKYEKDEFYAYRNHFYDPSGHPRSNSTEFDLAWNHHQKNNPHHWNYWCLINDVDEPQIHPLDMPFKYIIEMLCDWQSAGNYYGNTAYDWYKKQGSKMILSENTRNTIEKYIEYFK